VSDATSWSITYLAKAKAKAMIHL